MERVGDGGIWSSGGGDAGSDLVYKGYPKKSHVLLTDYPSSSPDASIRKTERESTKLPIAPADLLPDSPSLLKLVERS